MTTGRVTLSRFTPSLMSHELLERLFVARERTLDAVMARVERAAASDERNHTLLVGPRGAGKTHLVSLVYHRVNQRRAAGTRVQVAWLPEDPWTITTYRHLLTAVAKHVEPAAAGEAPTTPDELEAFFRARAAEQGPMVVIVENLDQILSAIGKTGQQQLRHVLQADRSLLLVATSTRLDRSLSDQASPFYGFFTTTRLEPFAVEEAAAMLTAIAREQGDDELIQYLDSDEGRARLRTIAHLAGGQPRMWAALASALTVGGLKDLVDLLLTRFDDLTPYYQEQLRRLSGQQRLVVAELAELDRPINVKELAERLEIDQRSLGKTMVELVDRGWAATTTSPVTAHLTDRRKTYYELAEPLARLSFQIKESRGEPLKLVVEFLKHWFDPEDLGAGDAAQAVSDYVLLASAGHDCDAVVAVTRQLHQLPATRARAVSLLGEIDDALASLSNGEPDAFLRLPMPVRSALEQRLEATSTPSMRHEIHLRAQAEFGHTRHAAMNEWITRAEDLVRTSAASARSDVQLQLADWLGRAWRFDEAEALLAAAIAARKADRASIFNLRVSLVNSYTEAGRTESTLRMASSVSEDALEWFGPDDRRTLTARSNLAVAHWHAGQVDEAIAIEEATLRARERTLGASHEDSWASRNNLAVAYAQRGQVDEAIELARMVLDERERVLGSGDPDTLIARSNLAAFYWNAGQVRAAIELEEACLKDRLRVLGSDHPATLTARNNLAVSYWQAGRTDEAMALIESVLADRERVLGPEHPATLTARSNLATTYWQADRRADALRLAATVVADHERVLGPDHPATVTARENLDFCVARTADRERPPNR